MQIARRLTCGVAACGLAAALMFGGGSAALAASTYTAVSGSTTTITKYLVMDSDANVPNATFTFSVAAGSAGDSGSGIYAGDDANRVSGKLPTQATVTFAPTTTSGETTTPTTTYSSVQSGDSVKLDSGQKYAKQTFSIDFSNVSFKEPGIYRYKLTESGTNQGVTNDSNSERILDVYVTDNNGTLTVSSYALSATSDTAVSASTDESDKTTTSNKSTSFTNSYTSHDLTISNTVSGNQASHDEYFKYTVKISGAIAGTVYSVDLSSADATTSTNGTNTSTYTNPASLTVGTDGTVTQDFYLQHGQSIKIEGLANNTAYTVTEGYDTNSGQGYTTNATVSGDTVTGESAGTEGSTTIALSNMAVSDTALTADTTVAFSNSKSGTIPTGVLMSVLPGAAVCLVAAAGLIAFFVRKRRNERA